MSRVVLPWLLAGCAVASAAPREKPSDLVDVAALIPDAVIDMRYATSDNFTGEKLYPVARCKMRRSAAKRLVFAANVLRVDGRRLLIWDCYRPHSIQRVLWKKVPDRRYVANSRVGSRHNRGAAIDLALVDADGKQVTLPTKFDDFSKAAHRVSALVGDAGSEARRLEVAMKKAGFVGLVTEWWHFDAPDSDSFALADEPL